MVNNSIHIIIVVNEGCFVCAYYIL